MSGHINIGLFVVHKGCPNMCSFCNQRQITGEEREITPADVDLAVRTSLASSGAEAGAEIAFFGGSFTMIDRGSMISLLEAAYAYVKNGSVSGIRISTRPDGIDDEICALLKQYGVTAVELGAQSMDDRVLSLNRRGHTAKQVEDASECIKKHGFELGLQMMTGLYGSTDEDSIETASKIIALSPGTVRIYPTVVLRGTELDRLMQEGSFIPRDVEQSVELCSKLIPMFENAGIKVIRVGLHSGGGVEENMTGGAYHPAFRELCEGRIYRNAAEKELNALPRGGYTVAVGRGMVSRMAGQRKCNLAYFESKGYSLRIVQDDSLKKYEVKVR